MKRVLVIKLRQLGDVILTTPVFRGIKRSYPEARITALIPAGSAEALVNNPDVDEVISLPAPERNRFRRIKSNLSLAQRIRAGNFDTVLDLTTSDRSALLTLISGAKQRFGFRSTKGFLGRSRCYTEEVQGARHEHIVSKHSRLAAAAGADSADPRLVFAVTDQERAAVRELLPGGRAFFQVHPFSRITKKNWPNREMAQLINWLGAKGWVPVITGSAAPEEQEFLEELVSLLTVQSVDLSGKLTLKQLGAVSETCRFFIGVDTGPMHIAAAMGTPVIAFFGPSNEKIWSPWCERKLVLSRDLPCRLPCRDKNHCAHIECLRQFPFGTVQPEIERFLASLKLPELHLRN